MVGPAILLAAVLGTPLKAGGAYDDTAWAIAVQSSSSTAALVAGSFRSSATFGGQTLSSGGDSSDAAFVAGLNLDPLAFGWAVQTTVNPQTGHESSLPFAISYAIATVSGSDDAFIAGQFRGHAYFAGVPPKELLTVFPAGGAGPPDGFVAKTTTSGQTLWAARIGSPSSDSADAVAVDPNTGNVLVAGYHGYSEGGVAVFGEGAGTNCTLGDGGAGPSSDFGFVASFNGVTGACEWAVMVGGTMSKNGIAVDAAGDIFLTGAFTHSGNGFSQSGTFGGISLTSDGSSGNADAFVAKLSGTTKTFLWVVRAGSTASDYGKAIAVSSTGDVLVAVKVSETGSSPSIGSVAGPGSTVMTFGNGPGPANGGSGALVVKIDGTTGNYIWAARSGGGSVEPTALALDSSGDAFVAGILHYDETVSFGDSGISLTSRGYDGFAARLSGTNGGFMWATRMGGPSADEAKAITVLPTGKALVAGHFSGMTELGTSAGAGDIFVIELDAAGGFEKVALEDGTPPIALLVRVLLPVLGVAAGVFAYMKHKKARLARAGPLEGGGSGQTEMATKSSAATSSAAADPESAVVTAVASVDVNMPVATPVVQGSCVTTTTTTTTTTTRVY